MIRVRHIQHAAIEIETLRHSGQAKWPQSKQRAVKRGHSGRLLIKISDYLLAMRFDDRVLKTTHTPKKNFPSSESTSAKVETFVG